VVDFSKLFDTNYLFEVNPPSDFSLKNTLLIIFGLIFLISVIGWFAVKYLSKSFAIEKLRDNFLYLLLVTGLGGIVLVLLRMAGASYFSMRAVLLFFLLGMLGWAIYLIFYLIFTFPKEVKEEKETKRKERYLPQNKRNKK